MKSIDLINVLTDLWFRVDSAKKFVDDGKEVLCSNKLQGTLTRLNTLIKMIGLESKEEEKEDELVQKNNGSD